MRTVTQHSQSSSCYCLSPHKLYDAHQQRSASSSSTSLAATAQETAAADKYYNIEEFEDKDSCLTEIFLNPDGSVQAGITDGPVYSDFTGEWSVNEKDDFKMTLVRKYDTGTKNKKNPTGMGEFTFAVERIFTGTMSHVGANLSFEGVVHAMDEKLGDYKVGFFEMIDTTEEREKLTDAEIKNKKLFKPKNMSS
jgi:hypothetical protein